MIKRALILILLATSLLSSVCHAEEPYFKFGLEWGAAATIYRYYYEYYYDVYETVMNTDSYFLFLGNGHVMGNAGLYFCDKFCASIHCGYMGIHKGRNMVPVLARMTFYPSGFRNNGLFCYGDAGPAFGVTENKNSNGLCVICHAGGGYRITLSRKIFLDFLLSARAAFDKPGIWSVYAGAYVPPENVRKSVSNMYGLEFSVGLNF